MATYATSAALSAEIAARKAADSAEADARLKADTANAAAIADAVTRITALEKALAAQVPAQPAPPPDLAKAIGAASPGDTIDCTGGSYVGSFVVDKPLTILNPHTSCLSGNAWTITAPDVTISHPVISGWGNATLSGAGIWAVGADRLVLDHPTVTDFPYAGIMVLDSTGVRIASPDVERVHMGGANGDNAYGIAFSYPGSGGAGCFDCEVTDGLVVDVPTWIAYNAHALVGGGFLRCKSVRSRRAFFFATDGVTHKISGVTFDTCRAEQAPQPIYDPTAFEVSHTDGLSFLNCSQDTSYPYAGPLGVYDYGGASTNLVVSPAVVRS